MTWVTCSMSRPRAAMSVATSSGVLCSLKEIITPSRWPWLRSPCSAFTRRPLSASSLPSLAAPILVRHEDDRLLGLLRLQHLGEALELLARLDHHVGLLDRVDRQLLRRHPDRHRVVHVGLGEPRDRRGHGRREEQRLAPARAHPQDLLDVLDEARGRASRRPRRGRRSGRRSAPGTCARSGPSSGRPWRRRPGRRGAAATAARGSARRRRPPRRSTPSRCSA